MFIKRSGIKRYICCVLFLILCSGIYADEIDFSEAMDSLFFYQFPAYQYNLFTGFQGEHPVIGDNLYMYTPISRDYESMIGNIKLWSWITLSAISLNFASLLVLFIDLEAGGYTALTAHSILALSSFGLFESYQRLSFSIKTYSSDKKSLPKPGLYSALGAGFMSVCCVLFIGGMFSGDSDLWLPMSISSSLANISAGFSVVYAFRYARKFFKDQ